MTALQKNWFVAISVSLLFTIILVTYATMRGNNTTHIKEVGNRISTLNGETILGKVDAMQYEIAQLKQHNQQMQSLSENLKLEIAEFKGRVTQMNLDNENALQELFESKGTKVGTIDDGPSSARSEKLNKIQPIAEELDRKAQAQNEKNFILVASKIAHEEYDPAWSNLALSKLTDKLQEQEFSDIEAVDMDCKSSVCKLELKINNEEGPQDTVNKLVHILPWDGESLMEINLDGTEAIVYLSREGQSLVPAGIQVY